MPPHVRVDPEVLVAAAIGLESVAARLQATAISTGYALRPLPPGSDEVSLLSVRHFNEAAGSFTPAAGQAIAELFETAAALRVQAAEYRQVDTELAVSLAPAVGA